MTATSELCPSYPVRGSRKGMIGR